MKLEEQKKLKLKTQIRNQGDPREQQLEDDGNFKFMPGFKDENLSMLNNSALKEKHNSVVFVDVYDD